MAENEEQATQPGTEATEAGGRGVGIQKIYLKDASFESPESPQIFTGEWDPKLSVSVDTIAREAMNDERHEVILKVNVEAKQDGKVAFLAEVQQAGVFILRGFNEDETKRIVGAFCPTALFPYAREAISSLVAKGGFPSLMLQPVNFDNLYQQQQGEQAQGG